MDKSKSKDNLRAAGKKRLEEFRQKKQQKGSSTKGSGTALKVLADDDKTLSESSLDADSSVIKHDIELQQKSEGRGSNLAETLGVGVEDPPKRVLLSVDDRAVPADRILERPLSVKKESGESAGSKANDVAESLSQSEGVTRPISSDQDYTWEGANINVKLPECIALNVGGSSETLQVQSSSNENTSDDKLGISSSNCLDAQILHEDGTGFHTSVDEVPVAFQETSEQNHCTEIESLKRQLQNLVAENEQVSNQLVVKTEQQLQETNKVRSLIVERDVIQQELNSVKNERAQLTEDFTSSHKELEDTNKHLASDLMVSQQQVVDAKHEASCLFKDFGLVKHELLEANAKFAIDLESMKQNVIDGELKRAQLMTELVTSNKCFQELQEEKALLIDELHSLGEEKLQIMSELDASKSYIQIVEEDLASRQRTLQQMQELVGEKSQMVEVGRDLTEKLEASVLAKELELEACRDTLHNMEVEKLGLALDVQDFGHRLDHAKEKEEKLLADLEAQHEVSQEQLRRLGNENVELSGELEKSKLLAERLHKERSSLLANFDVNLKGLREENTRQGNQLLESKQEVQKLSEEHVEVVKKMEIALDECRTEIDFITDEKSKVVQDYKSAKEQLLVLIEEREQKFINLDDELRECKDLVRIKLEENSSLLILLEESNGKLEKTVQSASELAAELENHRAVSNELLQEKETLVAELLEIQAQWHLMQQTAEERKLELERVRENLRDLEDDHSNLSTQLVMSTDEMSKVQANVTAAEMEAVAYREQILKLEEQNSILVKLLEDSKVDLQRLSRDNLQSSSDFALKVDEHKMLSSGLLEEKERIASEFQEVTERWQLLQLEVAQSQREHIFELEKHEKRFKELEDNHIQLSNDLSWSQDEILKLNVEKNQVELELARYKEQLKTLEDTNKDLVIGLDTDRRHLDAVVLEKEKLLIDHVTELDKFKGQHRDTEEANVKITAKIHKLLNELQELKNDKTEMDLELQTYKGHYQTMGDENGRLASELSKLKDQLQLVITEKELGESLLGSELKESREQARNLEKGNALLMVELVDHRENLQNMHEQRVDEIEKLQQQVQDLVQSQEQMLSELLGTQEQAQVSEVARLELLSNAEASSQQLKKLSEEKDVLLSDLKFSQHQFHELVKENGHLVMKSEVAFDNWQVEKLQLSRDLEISLGNQQVLCADKAQVDFELADLMLKTDNIDAQRAQLALEVGALKESMKSSEEHRVHLITLVDGKDQQVQALEVEKGHLDGHLRAEKEKVTASNDQHLLLSEDLRTSKLTNEELELEIAQLRVDNEFSQTQMDLLIEERTKVAEELMKFSLDLDLMKGDEPPKLIERSLHIHEEPSLSPEKKELQESPSTKSNDAGFGLACCVQNLVQEFKRKGRDTVQACGTEPLSPGFTTQVTEFFSQLKLLWETSRNQERELDDANLVEGMLRRELETEEDHLREAVEENLYLTTLIGQLEGEHHQVNINSIQVAELQSQVKGLAETVVNLQEEKKTAWEAQVAAQTEQTRCQENLKEENDLLADHLSVLEGTLATLQAERDDFAMKLVGLQQSHTRLSERILQESEDKVSLQNQVHEFEAEVAKLNAELENHRDMASQSQLLWRSLVQKLEDALGDVLAEVGEELLSSQLDKDSADYCYSLASKLHIETKKICDQLQTADVHLSESSKELCQVEEKLMILQRERDMAVETSEQVHSQLKKLSEEKADLEAYLKESGAIASAEKQDSVIQIKELTQQHDEQLAQNACDLAAVHAEVSALQNRIAEQEAAIAMDAAVSLKLEGELKSMVSKLLSGTTIGPEEASEDPVLLNLSPTRQLEVGINQLLKRCEDDALQIEKLKKTILLSLESDQALEIIRAENAKLNEMLQSMQKMLQSRDLELDVLNKAVEEQAGTVAHQAGEVEGLLSQIQGLSEQLEKEYTEKASLQSMLTQAEQKLSGTKEKLSLAVSKGKAVVQQRDAWKLSLVEKSKELDLLVAGHQQDLQVKDDALNIAERKIIELTGSAEQMVRLEKQFSSLQKVVSTAQQVFLENDDLFQGLCAVLGSPGMSGEWHSSVLLDKILWVTGCASKLQQELVASKEEVQTLVESASALTSTAEISEARVSALAEKLHSLEHEKEECESRLEDLVLQLQLEVHQLKEEKVRLTGIIRQLDSEIAKQNHDKEDLAKRMQDQTREVSRFEEEIVSLQRKVTLQQEELNTGVESYRSLDAAMHTFFRNLTHLYESISPGELDTVSADSSLHFCKHIMHLLITTHNLTIIKIKEILHEILSYRSASGEDLQDDVSQNLEGKVMMSREVPTDLIKIIEEAFVNIEQQAMSSQTLLQQNNQLVGDLAVEQNEKNKLQLELVLKEQRLTTVEEKLTAAVNKGKSLAVQQSSLEQVLVEKDAQLEILATAHKKELQSKELMLQETSQRLKSSLEHVADLEKDLATIKNSVSSNPEPSLVDRLSEMDRHLAATQHKANLAESEAENSRNAAALLSSELELSRTTLVDLVKEVGILTKDKEELLQQLQSSVTQYGVEFREVAAERTLLKSKISQLEQELTAQTQGREKLVQDYEEVFHEHAELKSQILEVEADRSSLRVETEILQHKIAELEMSLENDALAHRKLESVIESIVTRIQDSICEPSVESTIDSIISIPNNSESSRQLESLSTFLVVKYEGAMQEIQELSKQKALLAEAQQEIMRKALSDHDMFEQSQQRLASRDLELIEVKRRLEEADSRLAKQEDTAQGFIEEMHILRKELANSEKSKIALQDELVQAEHKAATTREKLSLAIKKGKGLAQQRDFLKQSLSEQQLVVSNLKEELQNKQSALEKATYEVSMFEEQVRALELSMSTLRSFAASLEQNLQDKETVTKQLDAILSKCVFPSEWQSRGFMEKFEWLVVAFANTQNSLIAAGQEADELKKASNELSLHLTDAQRRAEMEYESRSILGLKLEEREGELKRSQMQIAELEVHLSDVGVANKQTELLSKKILNLEALVQQKQAEINRAEETVMAWAERSNETEKYIGLSQERITELEHKVLELAGAQQEIELLHDRIAKLEETVQQKETAVKAMEASRSKAVNKLTTTVNKFRELCQQSEGLVVELEAMHGSLQDKDSEISQLKEESVKIISQSQILQEMLESKMSFLLQLENLLGNAVGLGKDSESSPPVAEQEDVDKLAVRSPDQDSCLANVIMLQNRLSGLTVQSQAWQADVERKDIQLQGLQKELQDIITERAHLKAYLQKEQLQSERLKAEVASLHAPLPDRQDNQMEEMEVQVAKRLLPMSSPSPHVRGARKPASLDVAIDVDTELSQLLTDFDDKGHGFKSLSSSRFMPRGTRAIAEQIDRLCVAGGRILMRQPAARLGLTLYWLTIHIWMVFLIFAAHV